MDAAVKFGDIDVDPSSSDLIPRAELIEKATHQWPFSVIQAALGEHAAAIFSPGLLTRPLIVPVHTYADAMLDYFAAKGNESKEAVLGRLAHSRQLLEAQAPGHPRAMVWLRLAAWDS